MAKEKIERIENIPGFVRGLEQAMKRAGLKTPGLSRKTGGVVAQNTISTWLKGSPPGRPAQVFAVERALGVPPGALSAFLGYLPVELYRISIETAVAADGSLDDAVKAGFMAMLSDVRGRERERGDPAQGSS